MTFKFTIHPSWFGGAEEADKAIAELAEHQARHEGKIVSDIIVYRYGYAHADTWNVDVEFAV